MQYVTPHSLVLAAAIKVVSSAYTLPHFPSLYRRKVESRTVERDSTLGKIKDVKLSLCLIKHCAMKTYGGVDV
jgi:hypothetical protein